MRVKRGSSNSRAVEDLLHHDGLERLLLHQGDERIAKRVARAQDAAVDLQKRYNFYVNQAYAQVFVAASSVAIVLWSASTWRRRQLGRGLGIYGCMLGPVTLLALFSDRLNLDAHGFGIVIFGQAVWFIVAGTLLCRHLNQVVDAGM